MSPVNSAARTVPVTAMPTPEATSVAVSVSAAPIVVRFGGQAAEDVDRGDDADDAQPGGHEHEGDRDPDVPEAGPAAVDGEPGDDRGGAEPRGPVEADPLARTG